MSGRIKKGEGTLIGNAGEYFVTAELLKRGVIAALAPRNTPGFDLLAATPSGAIKIRVKTKTEEYDAWQWNAKADGSIFIGLSDTADYIVLVNLTLETKDMDYFIVPTHLIDEILKRDFHNWVTTPGKKGQQRATDNKRRIMHYPKVREFLEPYRNNWSIQK